MSWLRTKKIILLGHTTKVLLKAIRKKAKIRNRYNQVPHLIQYTTWEKDKKYKEHHIEENQEVRPFQAGDHKAAMNRQDSMTDTKHKYQKGSTKEALYVTRVRTGLKGT